MGGGPEVSAPSLHDSLAISMGLTIRDVKALFRLRDGLRDLLQDDEFALGLTVALDDRAKALQRQSFAQSTPYLQAQFAGASQEVRDLPKTLYGLIAALDQAEHEFILSVTGRAPEVPLRPEPDFRR